MIKDFDPFLVILAVLFVILIIVTYLLFACIRRSERPADRRCRQTYPHPRRRSTDVTPDFVAKVDTFSTVKECNCRYCQSVRELDDMMKRDE